LGKVSPPSFFGGIGGSSTRNYIVSFTSLSRGPPPLEPVEDKSEIELSPWSADAAEAAKEVEEFKSEVKSSKSASSAVKRQKTRMRDIGESVRPGLQLMHANSM